MSMIRLCGSLCCTFSCRLGLGFRFSLCRSFQSDALVEIPVFLGGYVPAEVLAHVMDLELLPVFMIRVAVDRAQDRIPGQPP